MFLQLPNNRSELLDHEPHDEAVALIRFLFLLVGASHSVLIFLFEVKPISFYSTVSKLVSDLSLETLILLYLSLMVYFVGIPFQFEFFWLCRAAQYNKQGTTYSLYSTILVCAPTVQMQGTFLFQFDKLSFYIVWCSVLFLGHCQSTASISSYSRAASETLVCIP